MIRRSAADHVMSGVAYMEQHLADPIGLNDIADAAFISVRHLQRHFQQLTGDTINHYLRRRRLTESTSLFGRYERLLDVALAAGFDSQQVYSREFSRIYGQSPRKFRDNEGAIHPMHKQPLDMAALDLLQAQPFRQVKIIRLPYLGLTGVAHPFNDYGLNIAANSPQILGYQQEARDNRSSELRATHPLANWEAYCLPTRLTGGQVAYLYGDLLLRPSAADVSRVYRDQTFACFNLPFDIARLPLTISLLHTIWLAHSRWHIGAGPTLLKQVGDRYHYCMPVV